MAFNDSHFHKSGVQGRIERTVILRDNRLDAVFGENLVGDELDHMSRVATDG